MSSADAGSGAAADPEAAQSQSVPFASALAFWLKLGFISFGGPAGQISIMHQELVDRRRWISEPRFLHALNYTMLLPGPEAQQLATYIGWLLHGLWGGIVAGALFVLPSFLILTGLSWLYLSYGTQPMVAAALYGIKPAVTAIVLFAAFRIGSRALRSRSLWVVAALAFIAIFALKIPFPMIVIGAGLIGAVGARFAPLAFRLGDHASQSNETNVIDDDTPVRADLRFSWGRLIAYVATGIFLWGATMFALGRAFGFDSTPVDMGWFFTKAAFVTFGGAYSVLPYVYQGGVEQFQWLTATQMIDGLALGETTPGPLIIVVTFVGFVGGWTKEVLGVEHLVLSGVLCATVVTFFTFLPSFLFILAGGPAVESTRGNILFTAPLSAITAAVVGVVLNLAAFFAYHVFWPGGFEGELQAFAVAISVAAFIALFRFRAGIIPVVFACGIIGILHHEAMTRWLT
ncbi:MAG: chromate efflux transporter [Gammaproteobacteria bacterium]|nr:chromate efflux transporter [Gammaproteobacteria bacterium]